MRVVRYNESFRGRFITWQRRRQGSTSSQLRLTPHIYLICKEPTFIILRPEDLVWFFYCFSANHFFLFPSPPFPSPFFYSLLFLDFYDFDKQIFRVATWKFLTFYLSPLVNHSLLSVEYSMTFFKNTFTTFKAFLIK